MSVAWQADDPIPENYRPFFHFCDEREEIVFQAGQDPGAFEAAREGTITAGAAARIPAGVQPGQRFELLGGLYDPQSGARLALSGPATGDRRIRLGTLRVEGEEDEVTGIAWTPHEEPEADPYLARLNPEGKPVDFGAVVTSGGVRIHRDGDALIMTPLPNPRGREFEVRVHLNELPWPTAEPAWLEAVAEDGVLLAREPVGMTEGVVTVPCRPGVFQYRLLPGDTP